MALVKCPDCETELSDQAPACPKCARPMARVQAQAANRRSSSTTTGAVVGFLAGFSLVWGGCGKFGHLEGKEIALCGMGGAVFAILGAILGAVMGSGKSA